MKTAIIIPARYASTRYPGKPLVALRQADGSQMTLIEMSWQAARRVEGVDKVFVATDDTRIAAHAESFGASVVMTDEACENGSARCADAVARAGLDADVIVNLQGDAPLTPPWFIEALIAAMRADDTIMVATPVLRCDLDDYERLVEDRRNGLFGGTTAVMDLSGNALYFSKEVIPVFSLDQARRGAPIPVFHHVGVYAYRREALLDYARHPVGTLEQLEGLEQLRFLEAGERVRCVEVDARGQVFWELNYPHDRARIEAALISNREDGTKVP